MVGKRIKLINMPNDPQPIEPGTEGTIDHIDGAGHIHVKWDNGRGLSLIPGIDEFEIIEKASVGMATRPTATYDQMHDANKQWAKWSAKQREEALVKYVPDWKPHIATAVPALPWRSLAWEWQNALALKKEIAALGKEIIRSLHGKRIVINEDEEGTINQVDNFGKIHVNIGDSVKILKPKDKYEVFFADEDLGSYMGNKGEKFVVDKAGTGENTKYYLIKASSPHRMVDMFFSSPEEAEKYAKKRGLIVKNKFDEQYAAADGAEIVSEADVIAYLSEKYGVEKESLTVGKGKNNKWVIFLIDMPDVDDDTIAKWEKDVNEKFTKGKIVHKTIAFSANKRVSYYNGELTFQNIKDLTGITPVKIEHIKYLETGNVDPFIKWSAVELKNKFGYDIQNIVVMKKSDDDGEVEILEAFAVTDDEKTHFKYSPLIHEWWSTENTAAKGKKVPSVETIISEGMLSGNFGDGSKVYQYGNRLYQIKDGKIVSDFDIPEDEESGYANGGELSDSHTLNSFHDWLRFESPEAESHDKALGILHYSQLGEDRYLERVFPRYKDQFYAYLEKNPHAFYKSGGPVWGGANKAETEITLDNGTIFYIDEVPESVIKRKPGNRYREYQLVTAGVNLFFLKNVEKDESALNIAATEMEDTKQPTEKEVQRAMILKIGYDGFWYSLKAGGESASDHLYSSSLSMDLEGPDGEDVHKVIIKKYNTDFKKVLITGEEIRELKRKILKFKRSKIMREDEVQGLIDFLIVSQARGKYATSSKGKSGYEDYNEDFKNRVVKMILDLGDEKIIKKSIEFRVNQHQDHLEWMGDQDCIYMIDDKYMTPEKCKEETQKEKDRAHKLIGLLRTLEGELITAIHEKPMAAANGRAITKYQQVNQYWKELDEKMTPNQRKIYNDQYKRLEKHFDSFNDRDIANYIQGSIQEWFDSSFKLTNYEISGVNWFKLGFKFIAHNDAIKQPEWWDGIEAADGIKVGTGVFQGKENWRVTDGNRIGVYPKDQYTEQQAVAAFSKKAAYGHNIGYEFTNDDGWKVQYEMDDNYPIISAITIDGDEMDLEIFSEEEIGNLSEEAYLDYIQRIVDAAEYNREDFAKDGASIGQREKIGKVMHEFKEGKLHDSHGNLVTNRKQAIAIALSMAGLSRKAADGMAIEETIIDLGQMVDQEIYSKYMKLPKDKKSDLDDTVRKVRNKMRSIQREGGDEEDLIRSKSYKELREKLGLTASNGAVATGGQEAGSPKDNPDRSPKPSAAKIVVFKKKTNPSITITVKAYPSMSIAEIINPHNIRFPYVVGQVLNMGHRTWACANGFLVNEEDTCPEKRVMGIKVSDIPAGHPLRHIYPGKFK